MQSPSPFHARRSCGLLTLAAITMLLSSSCTRLNPNLVSRLEGVNEVAGRQLPRKHTGALSADQAIERAISRSTRVLELVTSVDIASKERLAARDLRDPELRLSYGESDGESVRATQSTDTELAGITGLGTETGTIENEGSQYRVGLRFFIPNPFERRARESAQTADIYARVADLYQAQWDIAIDVRKLFATVRYLEEDIATLSKLTGVYSDVLERERSRLDKGVGGLNDVMTASRRFLSVLSSRDQLIREQEARLRDLALLVSVSASSIQLTPDDAPLDTDTVYNWQTAQLVTLATAHREDLIARAWLTRAAEARHKESRSANVPWPSHVQASYSESESEGTRSFNGSDLDPTRNRIQNSQSSSTDDGDGEAWRIDAAISLPIFSWVSHASDVREAELRQARALEAHTIDRVQRDVEHAIERVRSAHEAKRRFDEQTQALIDEIRRTVDKGAIAVLNDVDVARLKEELLNARRTRQRAAHDHTLSLIQLEKAMGLRLETIGARLDGITR
jgi:outer membrane protein TolC